MDARRPRFPLMAQVGAVIALFAAALGTLWSAGSSVVGREERRSGANDRLRRAGDLLRSLGGDAVARVRPYPEYMGPEDWGEVDRRLDLAARVVASRFPDVEGGYYFPGRVERPFVPALPDSIAPPGDRGSPGGPDPPGGRNLYDYVETQADAAYRKKYDLLVVEEVPPETVAIQAGPVRSNGRVVAAAWTMCRLGDPVFLGRAAVGYRLSAGLSLAGIALSTGLTINLFRTVRRQAAERDRLQLDLRRSERLAALGKLLAGVAHEVRNPLAGIRSTAQLWQRGLAIGPESLDGLVREVDRLEEIVTSLLQFSRADARGLGPGDLDSVVAEAARLTEGMAGASGVRVELDLAGNLPRVAMAPPALLQLLRNLTINAIQAMPRGGIVRLSTRLDPARGAIEATVADTGPGLTPEVIGHLFEPFFTTRAEGTGLGLAIAREIALAHRGDLRAANRPDGPGAAFTIRLPADPNGPGGGDR